MPRRRRPRSLPSASACTVAAKRGKRSVGHAKAESRHLLVVVRADVEVAFVVLVTAEPDICAAARALPGRRSADVGLRQHCAVLVLASQVMHSRGIRLVAVAEHKRGIPVARKTHRVLRSSEPRPSVHACRLRLERSDHGLFMTIYPPEGKAVAVHKFLLLRPARRVPDLDVVIVGVGCAIRGDAEAAYGSDVVHSRKIVGRSNKRSVLSINASARSLIIDFVTIRSRIEIHRDHDSIPFLQFKRVKLRHDI